MKLKKTVIEMTMKLFESIPSIDDKSLAEIFHHNSFIYASKEDREKIMFDSSDFRYCYEYLYPFDLFFGIDLAPLLKNKIVLDFGCFTGGRSIAWVERYKLKKIYGIDIRNVYIEAATKFAQIKKVNADFTISKSKTLPYNDCKFDAILTYDVFEHVDDLENTLRECYRVLKKGGKMFVVFPSYYNPIEHHLSLVTLTPFLHYFFRGKDLVDVYNKIIDKREGAYWYKRPNRDLETWEKCNTINGMTKSKFRQIIRNGNWKVSYEYNQSFLRTGGIVNRYPILKPISLLLDPFSNFPILNEFISARIVFILEKNGLK